MRVGDGVMGIPRKLAASDTIARDLLPLKVYLDGEEVQYVVEYDMDDGTVEHLIHIEGIGFVMNGDEIARTTQHGVVTVEREK